MDPVSAFVILGIVVVGLIAMITECIVLICQSCHQTRGPSRSISRVFHSISRVSADDCYTPITVEELLQLQDYCETDCCPICIEEFKSQPDDLVCLRACKHVFHKVCIDQWIHCNSVCPLCKHDMFIYSPAADVSTETTIQVTHN